MCFGAPKSTMTSSDVSIGLMLISRMKGGLTMSDEEIEALARELEQKLMSFYGAPVLTGAELQKAMGYRSVDALRQAILRKNFPIPVFTMPKRRGRYAFVKDIAKYLATNGINHKEGEFIR